MYPLTQKFRSSKGSVADDKGADKGTGGKEKKKGSFYYSGK